MGRQLKVSPEQKCVDILFKYQHKSICLHNLKRLREIIDQRIEVLEGKRLWVDVDSKI